MAESSLEGFSDRAGLRRALAQRLAEVRPDLRVVAEGILAETSAIDLLAVGPDGELVSIRVSKRDDDCATLTRALADLTWLRRRRADLLKLSPRLGIDPSVEPRALVVCHAFSAESLAAVDNFPEKTVALWCCRSFDTERGQLLMLEPVDSTGLATPWPEGLSTPPSKPRAAAHGSSDGRAHGPSNAPSASAASRSANRPPIRRPLADPPSPSAFRSGLVDADLEPQGGRRFERGYPVETPVDDPFLPGRLT